MAKPKLALIPASQGSKVFSVLPSDGSGDFDFSRSGSATRINSQGLIETVSSGQSRLNYPLIDGVVNGCPSLLLEPQSRNIVTSSQVLTDAIYGTSNAVILDNNVISPDGTLNASSITDSNGGGTNVTQIFLPGLSVDVLSQYTYSIFAKKGGLNYISLRLASFTTPINIDCFFDLENGSVVSANLSIVDSAKIENYGNGWYRCSVTFTTDVADTVGNLVVRLSEDGVSTASVPQDGTSSVYLWGWSCEKQSYATSYIPTNGEINGVTRQAETANGAGNADTFNDSEGVLMAEISALADDGTNRWINLGNGTTSELGVNLRYVPTSNLIVAAFYNGTSFSCLMSTELNSSTQFNKIAFKYKQNDFALWVNGIELDTDVSGVTNSPLSQLSFDGGTGTNDFYGKTKQIQYHNSALTDSELEQLTSWTSFSDMAQGQLYTIE